MAGNGVAFGKGLRIVRRSRWFLGEGESDVEPGWRALDAANCEPGLHMAAYRINALDVRFRANVPYSVCEVLDPHLVRIRNSAVRGILISWIRTPREPL